jgi:hypothetical protein
VQKWPFWVKFVEISLDKSVEQDYPYSFRSPPAQTGGLIQHSESIENSPCRAAPFIQVHYQDRMSLGAKMAILGEICRNKPG